jgi:hypothetical protein
VNADNFVRAETDTCFRVRAKQPGPGKFGRHREPMAISITAKKTANCLPAMKGWNDMVRLYRPPRRNPQRRADFPRGPTVLKELPNGPVS